MFPPKVVYRKLAIRFGRGGHLQRLGRHGHRPGLAGVTADETVYVDKNASLDA